MIAGLNQHNLPEPELTCRRRHDQPRLLIDDELGLRLFARLAQACGLRLAAPFGYGLGEIGEQHREPQPEDDLKLEAQYALRRSSSRESE